MKKTHKMKDVRKRLSIGIKTSALKEGVNVINHNNINIFLTIKEGVLQFLDVEENELTGPAFLNLTGLVNLTTYRVSLNQFTGVIPNEGLSDLSSLRELWFAANKLTGTIPPTIGQLASLGTKKGFQ